MKFWRSIFTQSPSGVGDVVEEDRRRKLIRKIADKSVMV